MKMITYRGAKYAITDSTYDKVRSAFLSVLHSSKVGDEIWNVAKRHGVGDTVEALTAVYKYVMYDGNIANIRKSTKLLKPPQEYPPLFRGIAVMKHEHLARRKKGDKFYLRSRRGISSWSAKYPIAKEFSKQAIKNMYPVPLYPVRLVLKKVDRSGEVVLAPDHLPDWANEVLNMATKLDVKVVRHNPFGYGEDEYVISSPRTRVEVVWRSK